MECHVYSDVDDVFQGSPPVPDRCGVVISRNVEVEVLVVRCHVVTGVKARGTREVVRSSVAYRLECGLPNAFPAHSIQS